MRGIIAAVGAVGLFVWGGLYEDAGWHGGARWPYAVMAAAQAGVTAAALL